VASPFATVRRLAAATVNLLLSRAEFASLELAQTRDRLVRWLVLALIASVFALLALIAGSAWLTVALWPQLGWITLAVLTALYAILAWWLFRRLSREVDSAPPVLAQTLQELNADRAVLLSIVRGDEGQEP